jgi:hypothetical protein
VAKFTIASITLTSFAITVTTSVITLKVRLGSNFYWNHFAKLIFGHQYFRGGDAQAIPSRRQPDDFEARRESEADPTAVAPGPGFQD